ncbi:DUF2252 family protein [Streptomyces graminilatus]|uniref:DUF2252 family protein n=1 Tax=Streptomyces graminilatus TaxID=1464070 RepID=UPI0006E289A3
MGATRPAAGTHLTFGLAAAPERHLVRDIYDLIASGRRHLPERFRLVDMARKAVGAMGIGTRCRIALMPGRDDGDPLPLQAKESGEPVLAPATFDPSLVEFAEAYADRNDRDHDVLAEAARAGRITAEEARAMAVTRPR